MLFHLVTFSGPEICVSPTQKRSQCIRCLNVGNTFRYRLQRSYSRSHLYLWRSTKLETIRHQKTSKKIYCFMYPNTTHIINKLQQTVAHNRLFHPHAPNPQKTVNPCWPVVGRVANHIKSITANNSDKRGKWTHTSFDRTQGSTDSTKLRFFSRMFSTWPSCGTVCWLVEY